MSQLNLCLFIRPLNIFLSVLLAVLLFIWFLAEMDIFFPYLGYEPITVVLASIVALSHWYAETRCSQILKPKTMTKTEIQPFEFYFIISKCSDKCIEVEHSSLDNRANVVQNEITGQNNQKWEFIQDDKGSFQIQNKNSRKCLDVEGIFKMEDKTYIKQNNYQAENYQKWNVIPLQLHKRYFRVQSANSSKYLDLQTSRELSNGANVWQNSYQEKDSQLWELVPEKAQKIKKIKK